MAEKQNPAPDEAPGWASWAVSMVNGFAGDYLQYQQNGLAVNMAFYAQNRPLPLNGATLSSIHPRLTTKLCLLIHGLGCHEGIWRFPDPLEPERFTSYGALLQRDLDYTPFFVRYNTGLALAENGRRLATLIDELVTNYPLPVSDIVLIGHSMGGLIIRGACQSAFERGLAWVSHTSRIFYLGSPHDGAPLAQMGTLATGILQAIPNPITRLIGDIINQRSQGVKDLHAGRPLHEEIQTAEQASNSAQRGPWLTTARHYLIMGTLTDDPQHVLSLLFGDGLVLVPPTSDLAPVPPEHLKVFPGVNHLSLAYEPTVYEQIKTWCE